MVQRHIYSLGNRFRDVVDAQFDEIAEHPERFPRVFGDVRFARTLKFPYLVLFREVSGLVRVLGVFHGASDPDKWRDRASEM